MKKLLPIVLAILIFASCKKSSDDLQLTPISDYAPLTVGKYITYSLDSLVFINFGKNEAHRFYEVKYLIADSITDNLGRKAFRIVRYIRTLPTGIFTPDNTFLAVNTGNTYEFTENNLKYIKLALPFNEGYSWKGNSYIDVTNVDNQYLFDWDYTYGGVGQSIPASVGILPSIPNSLTVNQRDVSTNLPVVLSGPNATQIASKDSSVEMYAKGIGMAYRKFVHWEYQGNGLNYIGYGVTLKMIDHN